VNPPVSIGTLRQIAMIVACAAAAGTASALLHPLAPPWFRTDEGGAGRWRITSEEAARLAAASEVLWIDARPQADFDRGHLPGAMLLNPEEWGELMFENQDALLEAFSHPVIVYADPADPIRAAEIGQRLRELLGLDPVHVLEGDWRALAGPEP
jgi:rhodanese-related sulfurtransferase